MNIIMYISRKGSDKGVYLCCIQVMQTFGLLNGSFENTEVRFFGLNPRPFHAG